MIRTILSALLAAAILLANPAKAQFQDQMTWAGTSTGSANAQVIAIPNIGAVDDIQGVPFRFIAGFTNSGATTIQIGSLSAVAVRKPTAIGYQPLAGGEIVAGQTVVVMHDGTFLQLLSFYPTPVPTYSLITGGSSTFATPTGARQLVVKYVGGGGGGASSTGTAGSNGVSTSFNGVVADAGAGGSGSAGGAGGTAGAGSATWRIAGTRGGPGSISQVSAAAINAAGGSGGASTLGGAGISSVVAAGNAQANSGSGGSGGARTGSSSGDISGGGGGGGETVLLIINNPSGSYAYTVGTGGAGGGSGGTAGGDGASGVIFVTVNY